MCRTSHSRARQKFPNVPDVVDINKLLDILKSLGVRVQKESNRYLFQADQVNLGISNRMLLRLTAEKSRIDYVGWPTTYPIR